MKFLTTILITVITLLAISCGDDSDTFYIVGSSVSISDKNHDLNLLVHTIYKDRQDEEIEIDKEKISIKVTLFKKEFGKEKVKIFENKDVDFKIPIFKWEEGTKLKILIKDEDLNFTNDTEYYEITTKVDYKIDKLLSDESTIKYVF